MHQSWGGDEGQTELATETAAADDAAAERAAPAEDWGTTTGGEDWAAGGGDTGGDWGAESKGTEWAAEGGGDTDWGAAGGGDTTWAAPAPATTTSVEEPTDPDRSDRRPRDNREEEQDNTLTLDQYFAQKKEKNSSIPQAETRKVEQDESLWKGAKELVKGAEQEAYFVGRVCGIDCASPLALTHIHLVPQNF